MGKLTNLNPSAPIAGAVEKTITGTVGTSPGDTGVLHGIVSNNGVASSIITGVQCTVWDTVRNWRVPPGFANTGYDYFVYTTDTHFVIYTPGSTGNSSRVLGMPFEARITYKI